MSCVDVNANDSSQITSFVKSNNFQTKFGARCRAWKTANYNQEAPPSVQLRLNEEIKVPVITRDFTIADKKDVLR